MKKHLTDMGTAAARKISMIQRSASSFLLGCISIAPSFAGDDACAAMMQDSLPLTWQLDTEYIQTTPDKDRWWDTFSDPGLEELIAKAVRNNYDVLAALQRIEAARQMSRVDKAGYFPTIGVSASWSREQTSADMQRLKGHSQTISYFGLGITMNWEIDVFGRIKAKLRADKANVKISEAEYDASLVSLCSNLAKAYFNLRLAQSRKAVAESNIQVAEKLSKLAQTRYEVGLVPGVDPVQARMADRKSVV